MDENSELEEGEACYHKDDDDNFNPDAAFSYLDEKIKNVLGHFQKDFEGGVSAENLGAKFGGYGSFLPTYERFPSRLSRPKTPQRNSSTPKSPNNISMEGASRNLKAHPYAPQTGRPGNASLSTGNVAAKHDSHFPAAQVAEQSALKAESFSKAGIPLEPKTLKLRIKMGSDNKAQKNAAIYSGLGLDDSPSSSLGNSPGESGGTVTISQETTSESPTRILEVLTASHVPGGKLISPLHDSLLCLLRKLKETDSKSIPLPKDCQEHSAGLIDESNFGNGKQLNGKKTKVLMGKTGKLAESKHGNGMDVGNVKTLLIKKKSENEISGGKELLSGNLNHTALSNSVNVADPPGATARAFDVSAKANQDGSGGRLFSSNSLKEDSLESISGRSRSSGKNKKRSKRISSVKKGLEQSVLNSHKSASLDFENNAGSGCYQNYASLNCQQDPKMKVDQIAKFHVEDKRNISFEKEKVEGKKKSKARKNSGQNADSVKETMRLDVGATPKDTTSSSQGFSTGQIKMHKFKLQKDANKVNDNRRDGSDTNFEQKNERMEPLMRLSHHRSKDSGRMKFETKQSAYLGKSKDISSGRPVDNLQSGVDASCAVPDVSDKTLAPQTLAPAATASVLIQENWVLCDRCHKWRLLPFDTTPEQLPEKWLCSMLNWLPGMNRCDISEEETTKALNALYQVPVAENQKNPQNHASGTTLLVTSAHLQNLDQNNSSFNSQVSSLRGKKKNGLKEARKAGSSGLSQISNSKKNQKQESLKSRSLNDMTQVPVEANLTKKSSFRQKEKHPFGGEAKLAKIKTKRESGAYAYEGSKKTKTDCMYTDDNNQSSELDPNPGRRGLNSGTGMLIKANGRSVQNENECSNSGDIKHYIKETVKKHVDHTQVSSDVGSLDIRMCDKSDTSTKKRKLEDRQDSQNIKEESSGSGFRNGKKSRVLKIEGKQSRRNDGDGTLNRISMDHLIGGIEEVRSIGRNRQPTKHNKKSASQKPLDGLESLRRDGTGQISMAATSSSSKVSGSHKPGANFEEARASPVESVSSSPMRTSCPEKLASTRGDGSGNHDATNGSIPLGNFRRCWNGEGTGELAHSGKEMKVKVSSDIYSRSHKSSPLDHGERDSIRKISIKTKPSSRLGSQLLNGHTDSRQNGQHEVEHSLGDDRVEECHANAFLSQKSDKGSSSWTKDSERTPTADKKKVYYSKNEQEDLCSRKSMKYLSDVDCKGHTHPQETIADRKHNLPDKSNAKSSKDERNYVGGRDPSGQSSSDSRMESRSNIKDDGFDAKSGTPCITKRETAPEHNQDLGGQSKVMRVKSRSGMPKLSLHCEVESQQDRKGHQSVLEDQQGVVSDGFPVNGSGNSDISKTLKQPGKAGCKNGSNKNLGQNMPDLHVVRDLNVPSSGGNSSSQTATTALKDAKELRNYADRLKSSGFVFESNVIYFQAALKFLGVAALLETSNGENGRHLDMNQMQVYSTATKLCEMCAQEYEKRKEMVAAALAYKCMEVACMRVVYCKHSTSSRDRNELQATLQMIPQGDSPSSSASDVDNNLNNQPTVDKASLVKGNGSLITGTHVNVARNRPIFVRLLDFTQDVSFAMEASRKSQNAFAAANLNLEEAQNTECITSVKKVIDFSFQDVDGLICLVQQAMEAITRSGLGSARD